MYLNVPWWCLLDPSIITYNRKARFMMLDYRRNAPRGSVWKMLPLRFLPIQMLGQPLFAVAWDHNNNNNNNNKQTFEENHMTFDIVIIAFMLFIFCMVAYHCYLKREERMKIETNLGKQDIEDIGWDGWWFFTLLSSRSSFCGCFGGDDFWSITRRITCIINEIMSDRMFSHRWSSRMSNQDKTLL